jgi:hypothetical protein
LLGLLRLWPVTRFAQWLAAGSLIALLAFIRHPGATPRFAGPVHLASNIVHLLVAGAWLDSLPSLAFLPVHIRIGGSIWTASAVRAIDRHSMLGALNVGALGTMRPTAHVHVGPPDIPADAAFTHIHSEQAMADGTIDPGRSGRVNAMIRVLRDDLS